MTMAVLGIDLGATKISAAVFNASGDILERQYALLDGRGGDAAGLLVSEVRRKRQDIFEALGLYYRIYVLHENPADILEEDE